MDTGGSIGLAVGVIVIVIVIIFLVLYATGILGKLYRKFLDWKRRPRYRQMGGYDLDSRIDYYYNKYNRW